MIHRGWGVAAIAALAMAFGAGSAWGAGRPIHSLRISGFALPRNSTAAGAGAMKRSFSSARAGTSGTSPDNGTPPLLYGGGPLMHAVTTHVVAWGPAGHAFGSSYVAGYEQFLSDLALSLHGSNLSSVLAQYVDASGSALQSLASDQPVSDVNPYPSSGCPLAPGATVCLTDSQLQAELMSQIAAGANLDQSYMLLLPQNVDVCTDSTGSVCESNTFCGYHSGFYLGGSPVAYSVLPYTDSSFAAGCDIGPGTGTVPSDVTALDDVGAHELFESATDPLGNGYLDSSQFEIGDECESSYGNLHSAPVGGGYYNQLLNNDPYLIQDMWSNQDSACEWVDGAPATASVTTSGSAVAGSPAGFAVSVTGASATSYEWFYASPAPDSTPVAAGNGGGALITFPSSGTYSVWVQVTDGAGGTVFGVSQIAVAAQANTAPAGPTPSGGSAGSGTPTAQVASTSWLRSQLGVAAAKLRIASLLRKNGAMVTVRAATVAGKLTITWYATLRRHRVAIARGVQTVSPRLAAHVSMMLTSAGRALLKRSKRVSVTATGTYAFNTSHITITRKLTLRK